MTMWLVPYDEAHTVTRAQLPSAYIKKMGLNLPTDKPNVPGSDFSGIIHAAGKRSQWTAGQEVHGMSMTMDGQYDMSRDIAKSLAVGLTWPVGNGTLQQYLKIPSSSAISPKPSSMSWTEAAAIPLVYSTVYGVLVEAGRLPFNPKPEEREQRSVLILGGSSGTGNVAIQLAKTMGLRVVTTCSMKNHAFVKELGADEVGFPYDRG